MVMPLRMPSPSPRHGGNMICRKGQTLVEYGLLLVLLALGAITALNTLGSTLAPKYTQMNNDVKTPQEATMVVYVPPAIEADPYNGDAYVGASLAGATAAPTGPVYGSENGGCDDPWGC